MESVMCFSSSWRRSQSARVGLVAGAHVALADLGQLDGPAVLFHEPRGARERHELPRPSQGVLESGREQVLDRELGHELVEADALALAYRAQKPVGLADAGGRDGTHRPNLTGDASARPVAR
jgi:hypothetical protein